MVVPAYSIAWPTPAAAPSFPMRCSARSLAVAPRSRGHGMVWRSEREPGVVHREATFGDIGERRRTRQVVQQVPVDVQQRPAIAEVAHDVRVPQLVEEGTAGHHALRRSEVSM